MSRSSPRYSSLSFVGPLQQSESRLSAGATGAAGCLRPGGGVHGQEGRDENEGEHRGREGEPLRAVDTGGEQFGEVSQVVAPGPVGGVGRPEIGVGIGVTVAA